MQFLKENKKYFTSQLQGNISNVLQFEIKDLYKGVNAQQTQVCSNCDAFLCFQRCSFCSQVAEELSVDEFGLRNFIGQLTTKKEKKALESLILCMDLSGSMECSYRTKYKKINRNYVIRAIGEKNFAAIKSVIGEDQVIQNFKGIQILLQSGESIRDIALTFKEELSREKVKQPKNQGASQAEETTQYITRKQIIQIGVAKYVEQLRKQKPNTLVTIVYFNSSIEIPVSNFTGKIVIPGIEDRTIQQMVELGEHYSDQISIMPISEVGDRLIENIGKAEAGGQTALSPTLAFCFGLAKKFSHDLHQIVVVTDGLSNVGFAQTEGEANLKESKEIYKQLALDYAVLSSCVVNVVGFQDCAISYDVIDQVVSKTGGIPYNISFSEQTGEKVVTNETIEFLNLEMVTGFLESTRQFCYDSKITVKCSCPKIKLHVAEQHRKFIKVDEGNMISLQMGIQSINDKFEVTFTVEDPKFADELIKFTVANQYKRKNKRHFALKEELISVRNGQESDAVKDQSVTLAKQIHKKIKIHHMDEENFTDYEELQEKIDQNAKISEHIDEKLLSEFKKKKDLISTYEKETDKLTKEKRSMASRRQETYKRREASSDEDEDEGEGGFI